MSELLKQTIYETLRDWGHDIYLQRFDRSTQSYVDTYEIHTVRNWSQTPLHHAAQTFLAGLGVQYDMTFVMLADAQPKEQDRIYEGDSGLGEQSIYEIDAVDAKRGQLGEIVFYTVGATRVSPT